MTDNKKQFSQDEELSEFADRLLNGQMKNTASDPNEELRDLEETILRLHSVMPNTSLEESQKKQMLVRLNARIRKEQTQKKSFWASLFNAEGVQNNSRPQFMAAIGILAILVTAVIISPILGMDGTSTIPGTALSGTRGFILPAILLGFIIVILWINRKK